MKKILLTLTLLLALFVAWQAYVFYIAPESSFQSIYLVPKDAVFIIETQKPIDSWSKISESDVWNHLQKNDYFKQLTNNLNSLDTVFKKNKKIIDFTGNRTILVSIHTYKPRGYSFLYIVDLKKLTKLNILKNNINTFFNDDFKLTERTYHTHKITEIYSKKTKETLYISFLKNQLIASYVHTLIEASIDQFEEPTIGRNLNFLEIKKELSNTNLFKVYVQYNYIEKFSKKYLNSEQKIIKDLTTNFNFSGFDFELNNNNTIIAKGYTNLKETANTYLKSLHKSKPSKRSAATILPNKTAVYTSFTFKNFTEFYKTFENLLKEDKTAYNKYLNGIEKIENFLKISVKNNFISWFGNEIALTHINSPISKVKNDFALIIKTSDIKKAADNLQFIANQIRKKTPVKFKSIEYKKHTINFLGIKGFFNLFLGNLFEKIDKPYYTIIDDFVVFSNNPNTLKYIITKKIGNNTLSEAKEFQTFNNYFSSKSIVFNYINTPLLYNSSSSLINVNTKKSITQNKDFITCFSQIGFELNPKDEIYETKLVVQYLDPLIVNNNEFYTSNISTKTAIDTTKTTNNSTADLEINTKTIFNIPELFNPDLNAKKYTSKYKNGNLKIVASFKNGLKHGSYKEYYKNGKLKITGKYRKGKQVEVWRAYDKNGKLVFKKRL